MFEPGIDPVQPGSYQTRLAPRGRGWRRAAGHGAGRGRSCRHGEVPRLRSASHRDPDACGGADRTMGTHSGPSRPSSQRHCPDRSRGGGRDRCGRGRRRVDAVRGRLQPFASEPRPPHAQRRSQPLRRSVRLRRQCGSPGWRGLYPWGSGRGLVRIGERDGQIQAGTTVLSSRCDHLEACPNEARGRSADRAGAASRVFRPPFRRMCPSLRQGTGRAPISVP
jgi:hypothetical protein